jgi:hypothetical protein
MHRLALWSTVAAVLLLDSVLRAVPASAADPATTETEINRDETNPLGNAWLLKLESNTYLLEIDDFHTRRLEENVQFQPRISLQIIDGLSFVTRPTLNLFESNPYKDDRGALSRSIGFGDIQLPMVLSPGTGPAWLAALFAQQFWSFAGSGQRKNVRLRQGGEPAAQRHADRISARPEPPLRRRAAAHHGSCT